MDQRQLLLNTYERLGNRVDETLRIQHGDVTRLRAQLDEVRAFAADADRVIFLLSGAICDPDECEPVA